MVDKYLRQKRGPSPHQSTPFLCRKTSIEKKTYVIIFESLERFNKGQIYLEKRERESDVYFFPDAVLGVLLVQNFILVLKRQKIWFLMY